MPFRKGAAARLSLALFAVFALSALSGCGKGKTPARAAESEVEATVSVERVEAKTSASADSPKAASLARGAKVLLRGASNGFARVGLPGGGEGWIPAGSFERRADREQRVRRTAAVGGFTPQPGRVMEPTTLFLAPDYGAAQYGTLEDSDDVEVVLAEHDFYGIRLPGKILAFVPARSLRLLPPAHQALAKDEAPPVPGLAPHAAPPHVVAEAPAAALQPDAPRPAPLEALPADAEAPVLVTRVDPRYPDFARRANLSGDVVLRLLVDTDGKVSRVEVVSGAPGGMTEAAADAVRKWTYIPARSGGHPVAVWRVVRVHFSIDGKDKEKDKEKDETPPL